MVDRDRLASDLSTLRGTLAVRPPGVQAVVRTVARRRRRRLVGLMITAIVAVIAISSAALGFAPAPSRPDVADTPSPSPTSSAPPAVTPTAPAPGASSPGTAGTTSSRRATAPGCRPTGYMSVWGHDSYFADVDLGTEAQYLCPNEKVVAAWATYSVDASGVQHLFRSQTVTLDQATPVVNVSVVLPPACVYWIYFLRNPAHIPATIPKNANLVDSIPFRREYSLAPSDIYVRYTGSNCAASPTVSPH